MSIKSIMTGKMNAGTRWYRSGDNQGGFVKEWFNPGYNRIRDVCSWWNDRDFKDEKQDLIRSWIPQRGFSAGSDRGKTTVGMSIQGFQRQVFWWSGGFPGSSVKGMVRRTEVSGWLKEQECLVKHWVDLDKVYYSRWEHCVVQDNSWGADSEVLGAILNRVMKREVGDGGRVRMTMKNRGIRGSIRQGRGRVV
jgi:hypothetical protein